MIQLLRDFLFDGAFARRVIVAAALGVGGYATTSAGADVLDNKYVRAIVAVSSIALGGAAAVQRPSVSAPGTGAASSNGK